MTRSIQSQMDILSLQKDNNYILKHLEKLENKIDNMHEKYEKLLWRTMGALGTIIVLMFGVIMKLIGIY